MNVGIVGQKDNERATALAARLRDRLDEEGVDVCLDGTTAAALEAERAGVPIEAMADQELVVSVGGDGTFLYTARGAGTAPIMGVNLGEVGFLNAVPPGEAVETVLREVQRYREEGDVRTRTIPRIRASGDGWQVPPAVNEIVVQGPRRAPGGGVDVTVSVDGGEYVSDHADGVLVATPTGSTAYNLSEAGPLIHPDVDGLVVTEMSGRDAMPPLVVDGVSEIVVTVEGAERAVAVSDGRMRHRLAPPERITVERADDPVTIAGPPLDFFTALGKLE